MDIKTKASLPNAYKKLKFLVVDDFESFRMSLKQMLRSFGAEKIDVANHGKDAIDKCSFDRYDIILCDYNMGNGPNGQQVLEQLHFNKRLKHTSLFILITAETSKDIVVGTREYQPDSYIAKPVTKAMLQQRMDSLVLQRQVLLPINKERDLENFPKAITLCTQELQSKTRYQNWCFKTLANLYFLTGDYAHAQKIYTDALDKREIAWARIGLGRVQMAQQQYDSAISQFNKVIADNPDYVEAFDLMSDAYEALGKRKEAQDVLQQAVTITPRAILRQKHLGEVCTANQDLESAITAYRATIKHSPHSVYDSPDNYLSLGKSLSDISEEESSEEATKYAQEAIGVLNKAIKKYDDKNVMASAYLIVTRVHKGQNDELASKEAFTKAESLIDPSTVDAETGIELAKTLYRLEETTRAESLLHSLAQRFEDDKNILSNIEELLDEPVTLNKKMKARDLNKKGISLFGEGHLEQAIEAFKEALSETPKHPALNLNLIQVLLKFLDKQEQSPEQLQLLRSTIDNVKHIPEQHKQYKRFITLSKKLEGVIGPI